MKAVLTVIGRDTIGIIAKVSEYLADNKINILDISQTIMEDIFTMVMLVDLSRAEKDISVISDELGKVGETIGVEIKIQHDKIFKSMHRI